MRDELRQRVPPDELSFRKIAWLPPEVMATTMRFRTDLFGAI
ncbi:hypothetical protein [Gordonia lacunae]|nr:hypothetical protein [Gordonia lacunae]